jgi:hypothetical protein
MLHRGHYLSLLSLKVAISIEALAALGLFITIGKDNHSKEKSTTT